jgi:homoserine O-acetyltransferase
MKTFARHLTLFIALFTLSAISAQAEELLTKKEIFEIPSFTMASGQTIRGVRVGYETYGTLNEKKDNVILVEHFFLGNSHAAGKYKPDDKTAGYWDALIGPGKAIDTTKYFVISSDTLANVNANDLNTVTTGPASINPDTGKPYGLSFPLVTLQDFVHVQKALLDSLGIKKLKAVIGPSSGAAQSLTWATEYPENVERVIAVIPGDIEANAYSIAVLNLWMSPILMDPKWNHGDYYGHEAPSEGVKLAVKNIVVNTYHPRWAEEKFSRKATSPEKDPAAALTNSFAIESFLDSLASSFEKRYDANSILYYAKAVQMWSVKDKLKKIKAKVLLVPSKNDLLALRDYSRNTETTLKKAKVSVQVFELDSGMGHADGLGGITQADKVIRQFLVK